MSDWKPKGSMEWPMPIAVSRQPDATLFLHDESTALLRNIDQSDH
jgi:hypothetical protein